MGRAIRPDRSLFGKFRIPASLSADNFSAFLASFSGACPDSCILILHPLFGDFVGKLVDALHNSVKQDADVQELIASLWLLIKGCARAIRRDGECVRASVCFFGAGYQGPYLPG
jgi:hypothetical protein